MRFRFPPFTVDDAAREVRRNGPLVDVEPRAFDLLIYLIRHRDRAVSKDELQDEVWGTIVSESAVSRSVMKLRKALEDRDESIIKTVPRFGYRFVAEVEEQVVVASGASTDSGIPARRTPVFTAIAILAMFTAAVFLIDSPSPKDDEVSETHAGRQSVAVLPFVAMSDGADDAYFADGLTEEILNTLTQLPELLVTARTSAFFFKGKDVPVPEIAATLGVDHVVEGSVRRDGDELRITAQLVRARDGFHLWSNAYDRPVTSVFEIQTEIAEHVALALDVVLDDEKRERMLASGLRSPEAYVTFQKGIDLYNEAHGHHERDRVLGEANVLFRQTLAMEPGFSRAYDFHADRFIHYLVAAGHQAGGLDYPEDEVRRAAEQLESDLRNAERYAPDAIARNGAAATLAFVTGQWRSLKSRLEDLAGRTPCNANSWFSVVAQPFGLTNAASEVYTQMRTCDPLNWVGWQDGAQVMIWLGNTDEAVRLGELGMQHIPVNPVQEALIDAYVAAGRFDDAIRFIHTSETDERRATRLHIFVEAARGNGEKARELLDEYFENPGSGAHLYLGYLAQLGERELANELAAEIDARPYGYLALTTNLYFCFCGKAWDIEYTPNFAAIIEEAEFPWPPESPISWPLKDW